MRSLTIAALMVLVLAAAFALPACSTTGSTSGGSGTTITSGAASFTGNTAVSIIAGQSVTFDNSAGGTHMLVTGTNGTLTAVPGAPSELSASAGLALNPGDVKTVTFATAGTYHITCLIHRSMAATITVTRAGY